MFGMGMSEIVLIAVIALLVIGPKKLPEVAKALGKGFGEFKRAMNDFKESVNIDIEDTPSKKEGDLKNTYEDNRDKDMNDTQNMEQVDFSDKSENNDSDTTEGNKS